MSFLSNSGYEDSITPDDVSVTNNSNGYQENIVMELDNSRENVVETDSIRVFVRIRPLNKRELLEEQKIAWNFNESSMIEDTQNGQRIYSFDKCFGPNVNNSEIYETIGKPIVLKAMSGFNGTVFSYGMTGIDTVYNTLLRCNSLVTTIGSGKTWTMRGSDQDPGMMILCIRDILEFIELHREFQVSLKVCYLEVYNEEINDLLGDGRNLRIVSEDPVKGCVIEKLTECEVRTSDDFMSVLQLGETARQYSATHMNTESSRSHTIYRY